MDKQNRFQKTALCCILSLCWLLSACQTVQVANQTFVRELGEDIYGNPVLYLKDESRFDPDVMSIEAVSSGISVVDNRFVTTGMDVLGVGEYDFALVYGNTRVPFVIKVKDTKAPVVQNNPSVVEASLGQTIDWASVFDARDLSGVYYDAPANITGSYGEQSVDVVIRDRFGNQTVKTVTVNVS